MSEAKRRRQGWLHLIAACVALVALRGAAAEATAPAPEDAWPLWDGEETVAVYAERAGLPPTKTLDLGGGVKLELVLIPAGRFVMGTPEAVAPNEEDFYQKIVLSQALLRIAVCLLLILFGAMAVTAVRKRQRPKFSLARLIVMTLVAGVAVLSGMAAHGTELARQQARKEFRLAFLRIMHAELDEKPAHTVLLTQPYYMGKFEVTQEQFAATEKQAGQSLKQCPNSTPGKNLAADNISWNEAQGFCTVLSEQMHEHLRLPTEAEWEYACRAGTTTIYCSGDSEADLAQVGVVGKKLDVGKKKPNAFGIYDMHGGVIEWCQDWYEDDYYGKSPLVNPHGPEEGANRVLRGGAWVLGYSSCRSTARDARTPDNQDACGIFGFRVAVSARRER